MQAVTRLNKFGVLELLWKKIIICQPAAELVAKPTQLVMMMMLLRHAAAAADQ
jgi:hypothetical protein